MSKLVIVTGGIRGIGAAISVALSRAGYEVVANYHTNKDVAESFSKSNNIPIKSWDVSDYNACIVSTREIVEQFKKPISIVINNAGIIKDKMFHKMNQTDWTSVIQTNLLSCFNMCYSVINEMRNNNFGRIVNISSINALSGQIGQTNYSASKAGIIGFSKALALESATKNITVNCIAPGYIKTDMVRNMNEEMLEKIKSRIPVGRLGLPEEIARAIVFLASDESSFITGETLSVNGGQYMK